MNPIVLYLLVGLLMFASHLIGAVSGFGNQLVALPLLAILVGLDAGKGALVVLGTLMYTVLTARWHARVNLRELFVIVCLAGSGLVLGMYVFELLNPRASKLALGIFVLVIGVQGLVRPGLLQLMPKPLARLILIVGGFVHGAFTTGGPLLVVYAQRAMPDKTEFRSTLGVTWLVLNAGLMIGWTISGSWSEQTPVICLVGLPFMVAGLSVGEYLHHRLDGPTFRAFVSVILILNGLMLITVGR